MSAAHPPSSALALLAGQLHLALSPQQIDTLLRYLDLLQRWNATYNLTAVRTPEGLRTQHLADCLAVIKPLQARLPADRPSDDRPPDNRLSEGHLLDVGSGGGLPGIVIAICLPAVQVVCVDSVGKKAAFIRQAAGELGLANLQAVHARVEAMTSGRFDIITSRAFASLADFVTLTQTQLAPAGVWMAMKGQRPDTELAALPAHARWFHVEQLQVPGLDAQRCLVWMGAAMSATSATPTTPTIAPT